MAADPREDGFNYGRGWGDGPKPKLYDDARKLAAELSDKAVRMSHRAWALEMAIRNVRLASTDAEKVFAIIGLEKAMHSARNVSEREMVD